MGHQYFGNLYKLRGIIFFKLSPHEQKAFTGILTHSVLNVCRRIASNVFVVAPPFLASYATYDYVTNLHTQLLRKDPKEFENDV